MAGWADAAQVFFGSVSGSLQPFAVGPGVDALMGTALGALLGAAFGRLPEVGRWASAGAVTLVGVGLATGLGPWAAPPEVEFPQRPKMAARAPGASVLWFIVDRFDVARVDASPVLTGLAEDALLVESIVPASDDLRVELASQLTSRRPAGHGAGRGVMASEVPTIGTVCGGARASAIVLDRDGDLGAGFDAVDLLASTHALGGDEDIQRLGLWRVWTAAMGPPRPPAASDASDRARSRLAQWGDEAWCLVVRIPGDDVDAVDNAISEVLEQARTQAPRGLVWSVTGLDAGGEVVPQAAWLVSSRRQRTTGRLRSRLVASIDVAASLLADADVARPDVFDGEPRMRLLATDRGTFAKQGPDPVAAGAGEGECAAVYRVDAVAVMERASGAWITNMGHGVIDGPTPQLCDLLADAGCGEPLAADAPLCRGGTAAERASTMRDAAGRLREESAEGAARRFADLEHWTVPDLMPKPAGMQP